MDKFIRTFLLFNGTFSFVHVIARTLLYLITKTLFLLFAPLTKLTLVLGRPKYLAKSSMTLLLALFSTGGTFTLTIKVPSLSFSTLSFLDFVFTATLINKFKHPLLP